MINLITGLPGSGKTLFTIGEVLRVSVADKRPVFYAGISGVTDPTWTEIKADEWFNCPTGALILIDECQTVFRPRTISKEVPRFVSELETHRHKGLDLYMITQHPMLADTALRRLAGRHIHVVRAFGMQGATLHEWGSVKDNCDKSAGRVDSLKKRWSYDKAVFTRYKSAEIHTVKRSLPMRVKVLLAVPFLIAALGYYFYARQQNKVVPVAALASVPGGAAATAPGQAGDKKFTYKLNKEDAAQFFFDRTPRIAGLDQTAPKYDELSKPSAVPVPAACVSSAKGCQCYTQQATKLSVTKAVCEAIVSNGYFQDFNPNGRMDQSDGRAISGSAVPVSATDDKKINSNLVARDEKPLQYALTTGEQNAIQPNRTAIGPKAPGSPTRSRL